eukprot:246470-Pleurochrysis_carterae.AAC.1
MASLPSGVETLRNPPATAGNCITPVHACVPPPHSSNAAQVRLILSATPKRNLPHSPPIRM